MELARVIYIRKDQEVWIREKYYLQVGTDMARLGYNNVYLYYHNVGYYDTQISLTYYFKLYYSNSLQDNQNIVLLKPKFLTFQVLKDIAIKDKEKSLLTEI